MNLLNISSIEERTAFASERSSLGSRLLMIFVCRRTRTSRCASRAGVAVWESGPSAGARGGGLRRVRGQPLREGEDVLRDLALAVADHEGHAAVHREHECAAVGNDRVRDLAAEACLDVGCLDATRAVVPVRDELKLVI